MKKHSIWRWVGVGGLIGMLTWTPLALGQIESQIYRPTDPTPLSAQERDAAISELITRLENAWVRNYSGYVQYDLTPLNPLSPSAPEYDDLPLDSWEISKLSQIRRTPQDLRQATAQLKTTQKILDRWSRKTQQKAALLYIRPGKDFTTLILVPPKGSPTVVLNRDAPQEKLLASTKEFLSAVSNPRRSTRSRYLEPAQQLDRWLIQPFVAELQRQGITTLMLCTGQGLRGIPFAALYDGKQFLVERYNLTLIPAFSLVQLQYTDLRQSRALAAGADSFEKLSALPAVPLELASVQRSLPDSKVLFNTDFTVDNVRTQVKKQAYQIVHLATHGEFRPGRANASFIQFWRNPLSLDQFSRLQLNQSGVELLVLSACKTALGDQDAELGFAGMALWSGLPSAIGSLWAISDPGTLAFMAEFYQQLRTAPTRSAALRQTQIKMIQGGLEYRMRDLYRSGTRTTVQLPTEFMPQVPTDLSQPFYWAPFVLVGNPW